MKYTDQQLINYLFDLARNTDSITVEGIRMVEAAGQRLSELTGLPYQYPYGTVAEHVRGINE